MTAAGVVRGRHSVADLPSLARFPFDSDSAAEIAAPRPVPAVLSPTEHKSVRPARFRPKGSGWHARSAELSETPVRPARQTQRYLSRFFSRRDIRLKLWLRSVLGGNHLAVVSVFFVMYLIEV